MSNRTGKREREARNNRHQRGYVYGTLRTGAQFAARKLGRKKRIALIRTTWGGGVHSSTGGVDISFVLRAGVRVADAERR